MPSTKYNNLPFLTEVSYRYFTKDAEGDFSFTSWELLSDKQVLEAVNSNHPDVSKVIVNCKCVEEKMDILFSHTLRNSKADILKFLNGMSNCGKKFSVKVALIVNPGPEAYVKWVTRSTEDSSKLESFRDLVPDQNPKKVCLVTVRREYPDVIIKNGPLVDDSL